MTWPAPRSFMRGTTAWVKKTRPLTLVASIWSTTASSTSTRGSVPMTIPALFNKTSISLTCSGNSAMTVSICFLSRTSSWTACTWILGCDFKMSALSCSSFSTRRAVKTKLLPSWANWRALASPIPDEAPVLLWFHDLDGADDIAFVVCVSYMKIVLPWSLPMMMWIIEK